jgi:hypothetical protein
MKRASYAGASFGSHTFDNPIHYLTMIFCIFLLCALCTFVCSVRKLSRNGLANGNLQIHFSKWRIADGYGLSIAEFPPICYS